MADIQLNEQEFNDKMLMCRGCEEYLLAEQIEHPTSTSSSVAMQAFTEELTKVGVLIAQYKTILQSDITALETIKQEIIAADTSQAQNFIE